MILYAISLRGMTKDANGIPNYVWATRSQVDKIVVMRNNPGECRNFICIGKTIFSPADILMIEEKNTEHYGGSIPGYARDRYLEDKESGYYLTDENGNSIVEAI